MKKLFRNIYLSTVGKLKKIANGVHLLNSHYIGVNNDLSAEVFYHLLKQLNNSADFIKFDEAVEIIKNKQIINDKFIAFSFDDGFEECFTKIAPVLESFKTNAAFFINPGFINGDNEYIANFKKNIVHIDKNPMTWEMIKDLNKRGFIIGNHSYDHKRLVGLNEEENQHQIIDSKKEIEEKLNDKVKYFAWTYGRLKDIDKNALNLALEHHEAVFSSTNFKSYYLGDKIINRRHIEGDWPYAHVKYFLSFKKNF